jgi:hypothetical protein
MPSTTLPLTTPLNVRHVLATQVSPMFAALLDFALDNPTPRTNPQVTALAITSDGFLMAWHTGRPDKEGMVGTASDFERNLRGVCAAWGMGVGDTDEVVAQAYRRITDWRLVP